MVVVSLEGIVVKHVLHFEFLATNNEAEYDTMITGLEIAKEMGVQDLKVYNDSQLIVG